MSISLTEQVASVTREIKMRRQVYPRRVGNHQMSSRQANYEIACMEAVLATLKSLPTETPELFPAPQET